MKKLFLLLLVGLLASAMAFAGGDQEPAEDEGAMEEEVVTIGIATGSVGAEYELLLDQIERYEAENPNVNIEPLDTPDLATDRLGLYLQFFEAQSSELDIYQIDVIWPGDLAEHFVNLYDYGAEEQVGEHFPAIVENNTVDGKLVGMPWFTDAGLLYYRTDLLEKYGYDGPPENWSELTEMAETIQTGEREAGNQDFWGYVWQGNAYEGLTCDALEWIYSNGGGQIVSPDGVITVNNDRAVEALELAASWVGTISPPGVTGFAEEDSRNMWQAGNAAFMRNWPYAYNLGNAEDSAIAGKFDVSPLPAGRMGRAATLGGWQLGVSKYSEHPQEATDFLLWLTGYEEQLFKALEGSNNPTYMEVYDAPEIAEEVPFMVSLYDVFTNAVARPSTVTAPQYNETSVLFFTAVHNVLTGQLDAQTALEELELDLVDLLDMPTGQPR